MKITERKNRLCNLLTMRDMPLKTGAILILFLLTQVSARGQSILVEKTDAFNPGFPEDKYSFPVFKCPKNNEIALSINRDLAMDFLDIEPGKEKKSIFENVWATKEHPIPRLSDVEFVINYNTDPILSVSISAEGCGAYCEGFTANYNYDTRNGRRITPDTIFKRRGLEILADSLLNKKKHTIKDEIKYIQDTLKLNKFPNNEEREYYRGMLGLYEQCLENSDTVYVEYMKFKITPPGFTVYLDRCSAHADMALDEIGEFEFAFEVKDWADYLSDYGKTLLKK